MKPYCCNFAVTTAETKQLADFFSPTLFDRKNVSFSSLRFGFVAGFGFFFLRSGFSDGESQAFSNLLFLSATPSFKLLPLYSSFFTAF